MIKLVFLGQGLVTPCIAVFAKDRLNLSPASFAVLTMFQQFTLCLIKPLMGYIVDYFNKLKLVICVLTMVYMIGFFFLLLLPAIPKEKFTDRNETVFKKVDVCDLSKNFTFIDRFSENSQEKSYLILHESFTFHKEISFCSAFFRKYINESLSTNYNFEETMVQSNDSQEQSYIKSQFCSFVYEPYCIESQNCIFCCENTSAFCLLNNISIAEDTVNVKADSNDFEFYQFWIFAFFFNVIYDCGISVFALTDAACCETVHNLGKEFGKERMWGAIGWGLFAPIGGFLDDYTGDYLAASILFGVMNVLMLMNLSRMNMDKPHFPQNILRNVGTVARSRTFLCFEVWTLINGIGFGIIWYSLVWFVASIGGDKLVCGLVHAIQCCVGEVPFMFFSGKILQKVGRANVITLSLLASCARFLWYSQLQNPWLVLLSEWTHGVTYGLFYTTMAAFAKENAKPGTEATIQAIVFSAYDSLGKSFTPFLTHR